MAHNIKTIYQDTLTACPICGEPSQDFMPMFPCGHLIEVRHDEENQRCLEDVFPHDIPVSESFCLNNAEVQVIMMDKNPAYYTAWYFAKNKTLETLTKAVKLLVQEKKGLSYEIISHKTEWESGKGRITAKIILDDNGSFWWGTLSIGENENE